MIRKAIVGLVMTALCLSAATIVANTSSFKSPIGSTIRGGAHAMIGGPDAGNKYGNAKGSISGNKPQNPFLAANETFSLHISGLTDSGIRNVFFQFGTENGSDIVRVPNQPKVTETGATVALLGTALSGLVLLRLQRNTLK